MNDIIRLNVGGTVFTTTRSTLLGQHNSQPSLLSSMFSGQWNPGKVDKETDAIFIDRDPKYFGVLLNFLRNGKVVVDDAGTNLEGLLMEAEYFCLEDAAEQIRRLIQEKNDQYSHGVIGTYISHLPGKIVQLGAFYSPITIPELQFPLNFQKEKLVLIELRVASSNCDLSPLLLFNSPNNDVADENTQIVTSVKWSTMLEPCSEGSSGCNRGFISFGVCPAGDYTLMVKCSAVSRFFQSYEAKMVVGPIFCRVSQFDAAKSIVYDTLKKDMIPSDALDAIVFSAWH